MSSLIICKKQKKLYLSSLGVKEGVAKDIQYVKKIAFTTFKGTKTFGRLRHKWKGSNKVFFKKT